MLDSMKRLWIWILKNSPIELDPRKIDEGHEFQEIEWGIQWKIYLAMMLVGLIIAHIGNIWHFWIYMIINMIVTLEWLHD